MNIIQVFERFPTQQNCIAHPEGGALGWRTELPILRIAQDHSQPASALLLRLQDLVQRDGRYDLSPHAHAAAKVVPGDHAHAER